MNSRKRLRRPRRKSAVVYLAGAGPGDPGLLTVRAARLLQSADAVVYDGLVNPVLVDRLKAQKWNVSKHFPVDRRKHGANQDQINRLLVRIALQGKTVVRLKGGDPFIFGRGGEEASFLKKHGIPFEVVPGVSAGSSVPAYAGIPVTDRRFASSVTFVTCHEDSTKKNSGIDWNALARLGGTLVFFMGWKNLDAVASRLMREGRLASTPCGAIQWGTLPRQRVVEGTLKNIAARVAHAQLMPPALIVVGETVSLRRELDWFEQKPLFAKRVLITRPENQSEGIAAALRERGAEAIECPAIRIFPPVSFAEMDRAIRRMNFFDWVVFTSTNGADFFLKRLVLLKKDVRILSGVKVAAIGEATAHVLAEKGIRADLVPDEFHTEALVQALNRLGEVRSKHFLLPRADIAPLFLRKALENAGGRVTAVTAYRTVPAAGKALLLRQLAGQGGPDFVLFSSASTVRYFFTALPKRLRNKIKNKLVSIGPVTSREIHALGMKPLLEAKVHTADGLVQALEQFVLKPKE